MLRRSPQLSAMASALVDPQRVVSWASISVCPLHPNQHPYMSFRRHFIDFHKLIDKEAIKKEKVRLNDELSRGYFADISEIRKNNGKIAPANKVLIPSEVAAKFPDIMVYFSKGGRLKLPISEQIVDSNTAEIISSASLYCLFFRASSQRMAESWSAPFLDAFDTSENVHIYEVSFIDSWLLSLSPIRHMLLKIGKISSDPRRTFAYAFGDHYDIRKKLQILNLLTGYIFLLDREGKIRWGGFGSATPEEVSSLLSCATLLLHE